MAIPIPSGIVPLRSLTTDDVLYGDRVTSYRWEVLGHNSATGSDVLLGFLDGVVEGSASLSWTANAAVKGTGNLKIIDLDEAESGMMTVGELSLPSARLRPVLIIEGLPEIQLGVYLFSAAPEQWTGTGLTLSAELLDRSTVLDQDAVDESYAVGLDVPILSAVAEVIASAGEQIDVDATVTDTLASPLVWPAGTSKLKIVNDLLSALNYNSLWVDGSGRFQATPYVLPANRSTTYELLNLKRELVDGERSIYSDEWSRDRDMFGVPNKVIAVQSGSDDAPALVGEYTNTDPASPFSYPARGRWITSVLSDVDVPDYSAEPDPDASTVAFLQAKAQQSLIASSAVQAAVTVKHLPVPLRVSDVMRFANVPAGIDARHVVTSLKLDANALGLMESTLQEVIAL